MNRLATSSLVIRFIVSGALLTVAVCLAFALSMALVALTGGSASGAASAMLSGSVGSTASLVTSIDRATPLLLVAIGTVIAGKAGLINVGQEGQLLLGAIAGTAFGITVTGTGLLGQAGVLIASAIGGALWAGIAAVLRIWARVNETVSTLLLNYVAVQLTYFLVTERWLLQAPPGSQAISRSAPVGDLLPNIMTGPGYALSLGMIIAVFLAIAGAVLLKRTKFGFNVRVLGLNAQCADTFGVKRTSIVLSSLVLSGATAGLAGGVLLSVTPGGVTPTFSANYGWDGLLVALVANFQPLTIIPVALGFGMIRAGADFVVASGVNATIAYVFEGLIALAVLIPGIVLRRRVWAPHLAGGVLRKGRRERPEAVDASPPVATAQFPGAIAPGRPSALDGRKDGTNA